MSTDKTIPSSFNPMAFGAVGKPNSWEEVVLRGGDRVTIRPIQMNDVELERRFIETLSSTSRRFRFLETMQTPSDALLKQLTTIDPLTAAAFVAVTGEGSHERAIGAGRFSAASEGQDCEFAITVTDAWQNKGLGTLLMRRLIDVARARGISFMHSSDASDNALMRKFATHMHLQHKTDPEDSTLVRYTVELKQNHQQFIDLAQEQAVDGWCQSLDCSAIDLKTAVGEVGHSVERVRAYLTGRRHSVSVQ